jgi:hypothetical protein
LLFALVPRLDRGAPYVNAARRPSSCWTLEIVEGATGRAEPVLMAYPNCGYCGQRPVRSADPGVFSAWAGPAPQRCIPPRRQQAGRLSSARRANAGLNSDKPMSASTTMAGIRRKNLYYPILSALSVKPLAVEPGFLTLPATFRRHSDEIRS